METLTALELAHLLLASRQTNQFCSSLSAAARPSHSPLINFSVTLYLAALVGVLLERVFQLASSPSCWLIRQ